MLQKTLILQKKNSLKKKTSLFHHERSHLTCYVWWDLAHCTSLQKANETWTTDASQTGQKIYPSSVLDLWKWFNVSYCFYVPLLLRLALFG